MQRLAISLRLRLARRSRVLLVERLIRPPVGFGVLAGLMRVSVAVLFELLHARRLFLVHRLAGDIVGVARLRQRAAKLLRRVRLGHQADALLGRQGRAIDAKRALLIALIALGLVRARRRVRRLLAGRR